MRAAFVKLFFVCARGLFRGCLGCVFRVCALRLLSVFSCVRRFAFFAFRPKHSKKRAC